MKHDRNITCMVAYRVIAFHLIFEDYVVKCDLSEFATIDCGNKLNAIVSVLLLEVT